MRLNVKKLCQLLLIVSLTAVFYLNVNVIRLKPDSRRIQRRVPWVDDRRSHRTTAFSRNKDRAHANTESRPWNVSIVHLEEDGKTSRLYPSKQYYWDDRIERQLKFALPKEREVAPVKNILLYNGLGGWHITGGSELFKQQQCAVQSCQLLDDRSKVNEADMVVFQQPPRLGSVERRKEQIWALFILESPYHSPSLSNSGSMFNWTATYRHDSTIVAPYEKYVPLNDSLLTRTPVKNFAAGKTKKVAWFVSNCGARNKRRQYAEQLAKYIQVDIYGSCGKLRCPRFQSDKCFAMLNNDYKFYLAFENSNCRDYITEKFFVNGLNHDVLPIVMGAAPDDYRRAAPPNSFIHVDEFESPKALAFFLHKLDANDTLYNNYFAWKGLWRRTNTFFWCRVCALVHAMYATRSSWYDNIEQWWRGPGVCIGHDNWRTKKAAAIFSDLPLSALT